MDTLAPSDARLAAREDAARVRMDPRDAADDYAEMLARALSARDV